MDNDKSCKVLLLIILVCVIMIMGSTLLGIYFTNDDNIIFLVFGFILQVFSIILCVITLNLKIDNNVENNK